MYDHHPLSLLVRRYSSRWSGTSLVGGEFWRYAFGILFVIPDSIGNLIQTQHDVQETVKKENKAMPKAYLQNSPPAKEVPDQREE